MRLKQALVSHRLKTWPYPGKIGVREYEYDEVTPRSQLHVFDNWRHLGTAENAETLEDILNARSSVCFDVDTYRLLQKSLTKNSAIILNPR